MTAVANHQNAGMSDALKTFQLTTEGIKDKSSKDYGIAIAKKIYTTTAGTYATYYANRNARYRKNRNYANGRIDVEAMFKDRFQMNGKTNYISLNWRTLQLVNRIVSGLVGRWMSKNEKIQIKAIDDLSQTEKDEQYQQIEFVLENRKKLEELQEQSGVQLIPEGLPSDREALNLWQAQFQRLPEEICYELGCNDVLASNGLYDVLKEKLLHDSCEVGFLGTYTWMDDAGVVHVEWVEPENAIYSASKYNDFRDTAWRGQMPSRKISEIRKRYGKECNPDNPLALTEQQLWEVAQKCKEYQNIDNLTWVDTWVNAFIRPYDEWNVRCMEFEIKTVDAEPYTITKTKKTGSTYTAKGYPATQGGKRREKPLDNQEVVADENWNIYRGVYLPDCDQLVSWKLKDNMIRPQDPKEIGNAEFSYSFYMYQSYEMRNMAIPEKIEAAVDGMILALLKMQQVVARMRPTGAAIDESALQSIDYGLGDEGNKAVDHKKLYDQTGDIYYRGIDAEGNRIPIPIQELANSGFLSQMDGLIRNYQFYYQTLKDELGEDPNLITSALQPRVTAQNVEVSQATSEFATDYMYRAYAEVMKMTARKVSCLLKDSVTYGAKAYRSIVKSEDIEGRVFSTDIRFLPTAQEIMRFEQTIQTALMSTPELALFVNSFELMRVAQEDVKLAEVLYRQAQKSMLLHQQQMQQQNQQATIDGQIKSAQAAEQAKGQNMQIELQKKDEIADKDNLAKKQQIVLSGLFELAKIQLTPTPVSESGKKAERGEMPPALMQLMELAIKNIAIPMAMDNQMMMQALTQPQQQQPEEQQEQNQLPQPEMAA